MPIKKGSQRPQGAAGGAPVDELFFKAFQLSPALMAVSTVEEGKFLNVNNAFLEKYGYSSDEIIGRTSRELNIFVNYADRDIILKKLRNNGTVRDIRTDTRTKGGVVLKGFFNADIITYKGEKCLLTAFKDLTETLDTMQALRESESRYAVLASLGNDYHFRLVVDAAGNAYMDSISANYPGLTGRTIDNVRSAEQWDKIIHPGDMEELKHRLETLVRAGGNAELECRSRGKDNEPRWVHIVARAVGDPATGRTTEIYGVVKDITVRKSAEMAMRKSEENYRTLAESSPEMIYVIDGNGVVQYVNTGGLAMFGGGLKAVVGKHLRDIYPPAVAERHLKAVLSVISAGRPLAVDMLETFPTGQRWIDARLSPLRDAQGAIIGVLGLSQDISDRKMAEKRAIVQRDLGIELSKTTDLGEGLRICLESALQVTGMDSGGVYLRDPSSGALDLFHHQGLSPGFVEKVGHFAADTESALLVMAGNSVFTHFGKLGVPRFDGREKEGLRAFAMIPFWHRNAVIGCMNIASHSADHIPDEAKTTLEMIAIQIGSAVARLQAMKALHEKTAELDRFFTSSLDLLCIADTDGFFRRLNPAWERALGYTRADLEGKRFLDFVHPDDREATLAVVAELASQKEIINFVNRYRCKDGSYRWIEWRSYPQGRLIFAAARDITEKRQVEEALRENERTYRTLAANLPGIVYRVQARENGSMLFFNDMLGKITGYEIRDLQRGEVCSIDPFIHPEDRPGVVDEVKRAMKEGRQFDVEYRLKCKDGSLKNMHERGTPVMDREGRPQYIDGVIFDVTDRKNAETAVRENEEKYRTIIEQNSEGIILLDEECRIIEWNLAMEKISGIGAARAKGNPIWDVQLRAALPEHRTRERAEQLKDMFRQAMTTGWSPMFDHVSEAVLVRNGERIFVQQTIFLIKTQQGTRIGAILRDVTARKQAEDSLRESEERFRTVFEQSSLGMAMSDREFRFFRVNGAFCAMLGYRAQEFSGMTFKDITHPEYLDTDAENVMRLTKGEIPVYKTQKRYVRKDGSELWGELTLSVMYGISGEFLHYLIMVEDITARRRAEEELQRSEKLESLKVFAGGIAHDFNNLLGGIFGYIDLARHEIPRSHPAAEYLDRSMSAFERAKHLARQMLTFAKGGAPIKKPVQLPELLRDCCSLALSGSSIKCSYLFADDLWLVEADENQLVQVFSNLVINAWQAMPDGGSVIVEAGNRTVGAGESGKLPAGRYVTVSVQDEGIGIPEKILGRIFDPFFTTKQRGSGLGLATCHSIVTRHGGNIEVVSRQGEGSAFTVWLPASEQSAPSGQDTGSVIDLHGAGRVLVMDDERVIREMVRDILSGYGYEVVITADGTEALAAYRDAIEEQKRFGLVILDLTVPGGMGGEKTVKELRKIDKDVVAIVSSGYSENAVLSNFPAYGFSGIVAKPYHADELLLAVKKAIDTRS